MIWNCKVKCIKEYNPGGGATAGNTYILENGRIIYDNGQKSYRIYDNIEELNRCNKAQFAEIKKGRPRKGA